MVSEFIRRSHYNESVSRKKSKQRVCSKKYDLKVSVLSGRYFKLTDKEAENKERKISDVSIFCNFAPYTHLLDLLSQQSSFDSFLRRP